jgi:hypothetical protein
MNRQQQIEHFLLAAHRLAVEHPVDAKGTRRAAARVEVGMNHEQPEHVLRTATVVAKESFRFFAEWPRLSLPSRPRPSTGSVRMGCGVRQRGFDTSARTVIGYLYGGFETPQAEPVLSRADEAARTVVALSSPRNDTVRAEVSKPRWRAPHPVRTEPVEGLVRFGSPSGEESVSVAKDAEFIRVLLKEKMIDANVLDERIRLLDPAAHGVETIRAWARRRAAEANA